MGRVLGPSSFYAPREILEADSASALIVSWRSILFIAQSLTAGRAVWRASCVSGGVGFSFVR